MLPTLGKERQETYSPFLPICEETGKVLQVPINKINTEKNTIEYTNKNGNTITTKVTGGLAPIIRTIFLERSNVGLKSLPFIS